MGVDDGGASITQVELGQDIAKVSLDGGFADEEGGGDLGVSLAETDLENHVTLACGEEARLHGMPCPEGGATVGFKHLANNLGIEPGPTASHGPDGSHDVLAGSILEDEPGRPGAKRGGDRLVVIEGGQDQHRRSIGHLR